MTSSIFQYLCIAWIIGFVVHASTCTFNINNEERDLHVLAHDEAWTVYIPKGTAPDDTSIFINVCDDVKLKSEACPPDSSSCIKDASGSYISAGTTASAKVHSDPSTNSIGLTYTDGEICKDTGKARQTVILFSCGVGRGEPVLRPQQPFCDIYLDWPTDIVCAEEPPTGETDCITQDDNGNTYDLSPLIGTNWQVVAGTQDDISLSICRPFTDPISGCEGSSSCYKNNDGKGENYGPPAAPTIDNDAVVIDMVTDQVCALGVKRRTRIEFVCDPQAGSGSPVLVDTVETCFLLIEWRTVAACPLHDGQVGDNCVVTDPDTGYVFDLTPLHKKDSYYTINAYDGHTYEVNVCGAVKDTQCGSGSGACQTKEGSTSFAYHMGQPNTALMYSGGLLSLEYTGGDDCKGAQFKRSTFISFTCNPEKDIDETELIFIMEDSNCTYFFEFETKLACQDSQRIQCSLRDEKTGQAYDLSELEQFETNWLVLDTDDGDDSEFFINLCRPLVSKTDVEGCPNDAGACLVSADGAVGQGRFAAPTLDHGFINFNLVSGNTSTLITLTCGTRLGAPKLSRVLDDGEQRRNFIEWETSAACPYNSVRGSKCQVQDPVDGILYDFSSLASAGDFKTSGDGFDFAVGICHDAKTAKCGTDAAACQSQSGSTIASIGETNDEPQIIDGDIILEYIQGDACSNEPGTTLKRRTIITFVCDHDVKDGGELVYLGEYDLCVYEFEMRTELACKEKQLECVAKNTKTGQLFDLSSLIRNDRNWQIATQGNTYEFNVCRGLVSQIGDKCSPESGMCQKTATSFYSLGKMAGPQFDADTGKLFLEFTDGTSCASGKKRSARVDLTCDSTGAINEPVFLGETTTCEYEFTWNTVAACPITDYEGQGCVVVDSDRQLTYNLTGLIDENGYTIKTKAQGDEYVYKIGVCEPIRKPKDACDDANDAISFQLKETDESFCKTLGSAAAPEIKDGELQIRYSGGNPCRNSKYQRQTIINFVCDPTANRGFPVFIEETEACVYTFRWATEYACPILDASTDCEVSTIVDGMAVTYDLSPLTQFRRNWIANDEIENGKHEYQINVCKPLVLGSHKCSRGQGACLVLEDGRQTNVDLGKPIAPYYDPQFHLTLKFEDGASCMNGSSTHKTYVQMICASDADGYARPGVIGEPTFQLHQDECTDFFSWETSFACPIQAFSGRNCKLSDVFYGDEFDLSQLTKSGSSYQLDTTFYTFHLNVCDEVDIQECAGSAVCAFDKTTEKYYKMGKPSSSPEFDQSNIMLEYKNGDACGDDTYSTSIEFKCDVNADQREQPIEYAGRLGCKVRFVWYTSEVCRHADFVECTVSDDSGASYDLSPLIRHDENWIARDSREGNKYSYAINICRTLVPMKDFRDCERDMAACQVGFRDPTFHERDLGKLSAPKLENGQLYVEYTGGDECDGAPRKTRINFFCSDTLGEPVFDFEAANCEYVFSWKTSAACSTNGEGPTLPGRDKGACRVLDNQGNEYDLSPLSGRVIETTNNNDAYTYFLSVCSDEVQCDDKKVGACQHHTAIDENWVLGYANDEPAIVGNTLRLDYLNGETSVDQARSAVIIFVCDVLADGDGIVEFVDETDGLVYVFKWRTDLVCQPERTDVQCSVRNRNTGDEYDLSPLTRTNDEDGNWIAVGSEYLFHINVCHNLLDVAGDMNDRCRGSAACQTHQNDANFANFSIGALNSGPQLLPDGRIRLVYNGEASAFNPACSNGRIRTTFITFSCLKGTLGNPIFQYEDECNYYFSWATSAACSLKSLKGDNCQIDDDDAGVHFDLTSLSGSYHDINDRYGQPVRVSACTNIDDFSSPFEDCKGFGACRASSDGKKSFGLGKATSELEWSDERLTLTYENGELCEDGKIKSTTIVEFICQKGTYYSRPFISFSDSSSCVTYVTWPTSHACKNKEIECVFLNTETSEEYDLTSLSRMDYNWQVVRDGSSSDDYDYLLNVCHAIVPQIPPTGCDESAGICQVFSDDDTRFNLGSTSSSIFSDDGIILTYDNGSPDQCPQGVYRSSQVALHCGESKFTGFEYGRPEFTSEPSPCDYRFDWTTPAACPFTRSEGDFCRVKNEQTGETIDLNPLAGKSWSLFKFGHKYRVNVCGSLSPSCDADENAGICQLASNNETYSLGESSQHLVVSGEDVLLTLKNGDKCSVYGHKHRTTTITFKCDPCAFPNTRGPDSVEESDCEYDIIWYTSLVCPSTVRCGHTTSAPMTTTGTPSVAPNSSSPLSKSAIISISIACAIVVVLVVVVVLARRGYKRKTQGFSIMATAEDFDSDSDFDFE